MFVWDETKSAINKEKHGLAFEAIADFDWETSIRIDRSRRDADGEARFASIGWLKNKLHTIILTYRDNDVRIISLRRANRGEEKLYAQKE